MRKYNVSRDVAQGMAVEHLLKKSSQVLYLMKEEVGKGMCKLVDTIDSHKLGCDVSGMDPYIRRVAIKEPHLKISVVQDGGDLARQLAECRRRAGY